MGFLKLMWHLTSGLRTYQWNTINHVRLGLFCVSWWKSEIFGWDCVHARLETEQIFRWKAASQPSVWLFSLFTGWSAMLLTFPNAYWQPGWLSTCSIPVWANPKVDSFHKVSPEAFHSSTPYFFFLNLIFSVSAAGRAIAVSEETEKSMRVTWSAAPGNVVNYRITYKPQAGGRQLAAKAAGGTTTTVLRRLTPLTTYDINVVPVYRSGEGRERQGVGTTCTLV